MSSSVIPDPLLASKCEGTAIGIKRLSEGALATIVTLNLTGSNMNTLLNKSFANIEDKELLSQIVTENAGLLDLWEAPNFKDRYNETHNCIIKQVLFDSDLRAQSVVFLKVNPYVPDKQLIERNFSKHRFERLAQPVWATANGQAPRDLFTVQRRLGSRNEIAFWSIAGAASFVTIFQLVLLILATLSRKVVRPNRDIFFDYSNNAILIGGCLILNASAILLTGGMVYFPFKYCFWRPLPVILALSVINGMIFARMRAMPAYAKENRYISRRARQPHLFNLDFHEEQRAKKVTFHVERVKKWVAVFTISSLCVLIFWFPSDPVMLKTKIYHADDPLFDLQADTYYDVLVEWCDSASQTYWISVFTVVHALMLGIACFHATSHRKLYKFVRERFRPEMNRIRRTTFNCSILFVFIIAITFLLSNAELAYLQTTVFSAGAIFYSATTSAMVFQQFVIIPSNCCKLLRR